MAKRREVTFGRQGTFGIAGRHRPVFAAASMREGIGDRGRGSRFGGAQEVEQRKHGKAHQAQVAENDVVGDHLGLAVYLEIEEGERIAGARGEVWHAPMEGDAGGR